MYSLLRLIPQPPGKITAGQAMFAGKDLLKMQDEELRNVRGSQIALIFQDPMTSLNPVLTIGQQIMEPLMLHKGLSRSDASHRAVELLQLVGIPEAHKKLKDYPHQFSGGMRQRAMIAMSLGCDPKILIADEPTTALDVTIQAQIIDLVERLREEFNSAVIWITHDLGVVAGMAKRVAVMYAGFIIEEAPVDEIFENPRHPYTIGLLGSLPRLNAAERRRLASIEGYPPVLLQKPMGCPFAARCKRAESICLEKNPQLSQVSPKHHVACWINPNNGKEIL
jgi:oligopeptide transport system ATP-binding protein